VLRELAAAGGTDYFIQPLRFSDGRLSFVSFTSDHPGGFTDGHLELFDEVRPLLALRLEIEGAYYATRSLLEVYLGQNAAARVLAGEVRRGAGELASAAIFFCDMRGFTHFTDEHPVGEVVETLDRYFETVAAPIEAEGGEVLKFIGDALLAVFAGGGDSAEACRRALRAAALALDGMDAWNATRGSAGQPPLSIGIALHHGEVLYGNIGANRRLDFTVIGRAVNEASRVESLCKTLRVPLLATRTFASLLGPGPLRAVGAHALRGVVAPQELFTLASRG
jgi:adenylate cyclase